MAADRRLRLRARRPCLHTFGRYLANVLGAPVLIARLTGIGVLALFVAINLRGVATSGRTENMIVATKLAVLAASPKLA